MRPEAGAWPATARHGSAMQSQQAIESDDRETARVIGRVIVGGYGLAIRGCGLKSFGSKSALFTFTMVDLPLPPGSRRCRRPGRLLTGRRTLQCPGADDGDKRKVRREQKRHTPIHEWSGVLVVETGSVRLCCAECPSRRVARQLHAGFSVIQSFHLELRGCFLGLCEVVGHLQTEPELRG